MQQLARAGGTGTDTFDFNAIGETAVGSSRDVITDFRRAEYDVIDLSTIDADTIWSGNQSFTYVGSNAFSGEPESSIFAPGSSRETSMRRLRRFPDPGERRHEPTR